MVGNELGVSSRDVGKLCTSDRINMWSKRKPVVLLTPSPDRSSDWWKDAFGQCGMTIPSSGNISGIMNKSWSYNPPIAENAPKRLFDFSGYDHFAAPIITHQYTSGITADKNSGTITLQFNTNPASGGSLSITDFDKSEIGNCYLTANITGSGVDITISAQTLLKYADSSQDSLRILISLAGIPHGSYIIQLFLSTYKYTQGGPPGLTTLFAFPESASSPQRFILNVTISSPLEIYFHSIGYSKYGTFKLSSDVEPTGWEEEWVMSCLGSIWLRLKVTGKTSVILSGDQLRLHTDTFWQTGTQVIYGTMYNDSLQPLTTLSLNNGDVKYIYMEYSNALIYKNGTPTIPGQGAPGVDSPVLIDNIIRYYGQSGVSSGTIGHALYYSQYSSGQQGWVIKNVSGM